MVNNAKTPRKNLAAKINAAKFMLFKLTLNQKARNKGYAHFIFTASFTEAALLQTQLIFSGSPFLANTFLKAGLSHCRFPCPQNFSGNFFKRCRTSFQQMPRPAYNNYVIIKNGRYSKESCCTVSGTIARSRLLFKIFSVKVCVLLISALI